MTQSATRRSLAILERLAEHAEGAALGELCHELDLPKSVAHRLLGLLANDGWVRQDPGSGQYGLTLKLTLLGARFLAGTGLGDVSQPILDRLAAATGELARLALVEGDSLVWVGKAQGARHGLRYDPDAGTHVVLHATATGKAWLATLPEERALSIVEATDFATPKHFGPNVILDLERFRDELRRTRAAGHGLAIEEGEPGTAALAVVARASAEPDAPVVGTLSVAGPVSRFTPERRSAYVQALASAARELSGLWPLRAPLSGERPPRAGTATARHEDVLDHVD